MPVTLEPGLKRLTIAIAFEKQPHFPTQGSHIWIDVNQSNVDTLKRLSLREEAVRVWITKTVPQFLKVSHPSLARFRSPCNPVTVQRPNIYNFFFFFLVGFLIKNTEDRSLIEAFPYCHYLQSRKKKIA